jgi:hypothetical protein
VDNGLVSPSRQDTDERKQDAGMNLTIQPMTGNESESDADRQREAELRRNSKRLRRGQSRPFLGSTPRELTNRP